jgi:hypothetical protein
MALVVGAATVLVARLNPSRGTNLARHCRVSSSSREPASGPPESVVDGDPWARGVVTREADQPWLLLDLGGEQTVRRALVYNCFDCPLGGSSPLAIEVSRDGRDFIKAAQREGAFELWDQPIPPARVRFVRLRLMRQGSLRLREVEVY